jgi:AcrR family transcriptional regulator
MPSRQTQESPATPAADVAASAAPPRRRRKEARPQELTQAALALFVSKGYAATRLEDIARLAGVSKGALYLYFDSKEALFEAVIREGILPVLDGGEAMMANYQGNAADLVRTLLFTWWNNVGSTPLAGVIKLMISEAGNFPAVATYYYDNVIVRGRRLLSEALQRGVANGEFRAIDIPMAIEVIFSPLLMLVLMRYSLTPCYPDGLPDPRAYLECHVGLLLDGLKK